MLIEMMIIQKDYCLGFPYNSLLYLCLCLCLCLYTGDIYILFWGYTGFFFKLRAKIT